MEVKALATSAIGTGKTITRVVNDFNNDIEASNYSLLWNLTMDVTARPVTVKASVYDGTTTINGTALTTVSNLGSTHKRDRSGTSLQM